MTSFMSMFVVIAVTTGAVGLSALLLLTIVSDIYYARQKS